MAGSMFVDKDVTRISTAIFNNDMDELKKALADGEDPFYTDRKHNTYLHYVCTMHRPFIIHIIVGTGINLNAQNRHGNTALHVTALQHECCHVGDLMAAGVNPFIKNRDGRTASEIPTKNRFWKFIYEKYQPGIFEAIAAHDVDKVLNLLHCWTRVDTLRDGKTLRQFAACRKFHDIVFHVDFHRHTLGAIYAVLERDAEKAWTFLTHAKCDVNYVNYGADSCHILQYAIKLKDVRLVRMICKSKVNVNLRVTLQNYIKAPLYFAVLDPNVSDDIMWTVLKAGANFTLKDERGRNAAVYALDKTHRKVSAEVIEYMMKNDLDVSQRDMTGVTLRDVARLARRTDIVTLVDKAYVKLIRTSNLKELERLCVVRYDSMLINFNYRDTFIYASGNETEEAVEFTKWLQEFDLEVRKFHYIVRHRSLDDVINLLASTDRPEMLVNARDRGGRAAIHLCVLYWRFDVLKLLLHHDAVDINACDNLGRTAYHYTCAVEEEDERKDFCFLLTDAGINQELCDCSGHRAVDYINSRKANEWLAKERKMRYGMVKQLACVDKYEELCHLMKYRGKTLKHFNMAVRNFKYPVPLFAALLSPLMPEYRDLMFVAMDHAKEDIVVKLIQLGADWNRRELCETKAECEEKGEMQSVIMSVKERAKILGMTKVLYAIEKKKDFLLRRAEERRTWKKGTDRKSTKGQARVENLRVTQKPSGSEGDEEQNVSFEESVVESDEEYDGSIEEGQEDAGDKDADEQDYVDEEFEEVEVENSSNASHNIDDQDEDFHDFYSKDSFEL
ncbi:uncharacterized protein LOC101860591 [Aplysia californica]|uniref:Uncharacterized protein LOC101860591 n=1 Tax=Aplysia californica TaxID=6500 RepID=A0ABM0JXN7_APLCA|nr:uncharacterized protein LOC101860591 [Aplysia californica]XP_012941121.1 uncharacterized protein LOC101860591 [Aplysia californica]